MSGERIETAGELDALPVGSVVADASGEHYFAHDLPGGVQGTLWRCIHGESWQPAEMVGEATHPMTVAYRPDRDLIAEAEARGARNTWRAAADLVAKIAPPNAELYGDGREDPIAASWVGGLHDAYVALDEKARRSETTVTDFDTTARQEAERRYGHPDADYEDRIENTAARDAFEAGARWGAEQADAALTKALGQRDAVAVTAERMTSYARQAEAVLREVAALADTWAREIAHGPIGYIEVRQTHVDALLRFLATAQQTGADR